MRVAVMGAGAVGCFYGAMLARAGHHVTLIGRQQHVAAVRERGLILEMGGTTHTVTVGATTDPSGIADADVVLFCVKSDDTAAAGATCCRISVTTRSSSPCRTGSTMRPVWRLACTGPSSRPPSMSRPICRRQDMSGTAAVANS